jgi:DNA-binding HxlR family transcriptional regulator
MKKAPWSVLVTPAKPEQDRDPEGTETGPRSMRTDTSATGRPPETRSARTGPARNGLAAEARRHGKLGKSAKVGNTYVQTCPTRLVLDRIADKWTVLILGLLGEGPVRFNRLRREIEGLSQKVLAQTLRKLERDGLVRRTAFPTVPVTVEYALTPLGGTLADTVDALRVWAETHIGQIEAAQRAYDARTAGTAPR